MRNLDFVSGWQCTKGIGSHTVKGKTGVYTVTISNSETIPHTCTCPHFVNRNLADKGLTCKHIDEVMYTQVCGWNSVIFGGELVNGKCPRCGSDVEAIKVVV